MTDQNRDDKTTFRRYILHLPPVGHGGMGEVYRATDRLTQRQVALKRLLTGAGDFARDALAQEFRILTSLQHPNIVAVQDYGLDSQQQPYFTMEFLDNAELMSDLDSSVSIYERTEYLIHLLQALVYLERRGILHRDLKPDNALIDEHNMIKVLDFGLSLEFKNFQSSGIVGTIRYMAPEVLQEQQITVATDLFAVGVIAYELFTGEHPFDTSSTMKLIQDILSSDPDFDLLSSIVLSTIHINQPAGEPPETQGASASDMTGVDTLPDTETVLSLEIPPIKTETLTEENVIIKDSPDETFDDLSETVIADEKHIRTNLTLSNEPIDLQDNDTTMREGLMASQSDPADDVPAIVHVVRKLLEKNPEDRYQSPGEVIEAICMALGLDIPEETETIRAGFLQNARFIGREDSSKQLADALTDLRQGQGSFWLIGGESGAGKSRLIDEFTDYGLLEGVTIIRGQAKDDIENSLWQNPIRHYCLQVDFPVRDIQILLPYFPEINDLLETDYAPAKPLQSKAQRNRLNQTIARVFALSNEPLVIILEDLQWAGDDLDALELLTALSGDAPLMIISAYRDDEASDLPEKLKPAPENHIVLERLDQTEIRELSIAILGDEGDQDRLIEYLEKETEGNVFFLVEILRALAEESGELAAILRMEMPENIEVTPIQRIIEKQLSFVPDSALPLLETAALAGRYLDTDVLSAIAEQDSIDDWLRICANVSVIERQDEQWRFRHDKLREGLLAGLDEARLKPLHLSIARAIESAYPGKLQQYAESLAHHYRMADLPEKETRFAFLAGESRFSRAIFPLALEYLERAMAIRPPDDAVFHAQLLRRLSQTYHGLTRYDDALKFARDGLVLAEKIGDLVLIATLHNVLGRVYMAQRKLDPAQQEYDSVQEIATQTGDTDNLALAKFNSATIRLIQDNYDEALPRKSVV